MQSADYRAQSTEYTACRAQSTDYRIQSATEHRILSKECRLWHAEYRVQSGTHLVTDAQNLSPETLMYAKIRTFEHKMRVFTTKMA